MRTQRTTNNKFITFQKRHFYSPPLALAVRAVRVHSVVVVPLFLPHAQHFPNELFFFIFYFVHFLARLLFRSHCHETLWYTHTRTHMHTHTSQAQLAALTHFTGCWYPLCHERERAAALSRRCGQILRPDWARRHHTAAITPRPLIRNQTHPPPPTRQHTRSRPEHGG